MPLSQNTWTVHDVRNLPVRGPWDTKSGGHLHVLFALPLGTVQERHFNYRPEELKDIPDIRGLRIYTVGDLSKGKIGGNEWHRIREEMVFVLKGSVRWMCEDAIGGKTETILDRTVGVWMPPYILHTYEVLEDDSELLVVANTLYNHDDPLTHDTFSLDEFRKRQGEMLCVHQ